MTTLTLPGLVDMHVHARDLAQTHKEDWSSATAAALAGGFTVICAMPNTQPPITTPDALSAYEAAAAQRARCDFGIYLGATASNADFMRAHVRRTAGVKMYLDATFGELRMDALDALVAHCAACPPDKPLLAHAEDRTVAAAILAAHLAGRSIHICHVSRRSEILLIRAAKERGFAVTCEVCPHHLFLTLEAAHLAPGFAEVRPSLGSAEDVRALWENLAYVDCFATDHAPHTREEKATAAPPGFPGLETALALWITAVHQGRLTLDDLRVRLCDNPRRVLHLPPQPDTHIEVDVDARWTVRAAEMHSRCGWSPFEGWELQGRVTRVVLRGRTAYEAGRVLAPPGSGRNLFASSPHAHDRNKQDA